MDLDLQRRTVAIRYDGTPGWPNPDTTGEALLANFGLPVRLPYRRVWCGVFALPDTDGEPTFSMQLIAKDQRGQESILFGWTVDYQAPATLDGIGWNDSVVQIRPPFGVTVEAGDPDKSSAAHSGAGGAMVAQWRDVALGNVRMTMFPMEFGASWQSVKLRIYGFSYNAAKNPSGTIYAATMVQSQMAPF